MADLLTGEMQHLEIHDKPTKLSSNETWEIFKKFYTDMRTKVKQYMEHTKLQKHKKYFKIVCILFQIQYGIKEVE